MRWRPPTLPEIRSRESLDPRSSEFLAPAAANLLSLVDGILTFQTDRCGTRCLMKRPKVRSAAEFDVDRRTAEA